MSCRRKSGSRIAFPSTGRKGKRVGELWHAATSDDESFEVIVRADIAEAG